MTVASILKTKGSETITLPENSTVEEAVALLAEKRIGAVVVAASDGGVAGIFSERDVVRGLSGLGTDLLQSAVSTLMTRDVVTCASSDTIDAVMEKMSQGRFRHVPVVEDGRLIGIISIGDIVKSKISQLEHETSAMRDYIAGHG
ncbi:MAG: CBS domain-containing protein [Alphaproteobacteria bacterium]